MPSFRWKGRGPHGGTITGDIAARSKEEALVRLRQQQIVVSQITETSGDEAVDFRPAEPDHLVDPAALHAAGQRAANAPTRLKGLLIIAGFVVAALAVGLMAPITIWTCERTNDGRVDCSLSERDLGVIPLRQQTLSDVSSIDVETDGFTEQRETRRAARSQSRLVLLNRKGESIRPVGWDQSEPGEWMAIGTPTDGIRERFQTFLSDGAQTRISAWGGQSVPLLLAGLLLLLALAMLLLTVLSLFARPTEWVQAQVRNHQRVSRS